MVNTIPLNYELQFEPLFHNFTFNGIEIISINLPKTTNSIILDAAELKIKNCHIQQGTKIISAKVHLDEKNEKLTIKIKKKIKFIKGDIRNKELLNRALKNTDAVIHLAYVNGTKYFYSKPVLVLDIAIKGILNVLDGCIKNNIKELYLASSSEVYQTPTKVPTDEKESLKIPDIYNPRYSYATGKLISEIMLLNSSFFERSVIFRPHNIYGPNMGYNHVIPEIILKIFKSNKKLKIQGKGLNSRSFCYIDDFIKAFNILLEKGKNKNI